ncbi:hypothetical protein [Kibdelosporangium aridum]
MSRNRRFRRVWDRGKMVCLFTEAEADLLVGRVRALCVELADRL